MPLYRYYSLWRLLGDADEWTVRNHDQVSYISEVKHRKHFHCFDHVFHHNGRNKASSQNPSSFHLKCLIRTPKSVEWSPLHWSCRSLQSILNTTCLQECFLSSNEYEVYQSTSSQSRSTSTQSMGKASWSHWLFAKLSQVPLLYELHFCHHQRLSQVYVSVQRWRCSVQRT